MSEHTLVCHPTGYPNSWDHLHDELKLLDLILERQILNGRDAAVRNSPQEPFRGLVISETEVTQLLAVTTESTPLALEQVQQLNAQIKQCEAMIGQRCALSEQSDLRLSLPRLMAIFNLTVFEARVLVVALAPELDIKYEKIYAYLQDDLSRKKPGIQLILDLLCQTEEEKWLARLAFEPNAPLMRYLLQSVQYGSDAPASLLRQCVKLDHRLVNYLLEYRQFDSRVADYLAWDDITELEALRPAEQQLALRVQKFREYFSALRRPEMTSPVFYFYGPGGTGKKNRIRQICRYLKLDLLVVDFQAVGSKEEEVWRLIGREAVLYQAAICVEHFNWEIEGSRLDVRQISALNREMVQWGLPLFLVGRSVWHQMEFPGFSVIQEEFALPDELQRKRLWESIAEQFPVEPVADWGAVASQFRFTPGQIFQSLVKAEQLAAWRSPEQVRISGGDLYQACRGYANPQLNALAKKSKLRYCWEQIVLPDDQTEQLHNICTQAKFRYRVYGEWGFDRKIAYGKGLNVLFFGVPGTGKTMAAEVIAGELQLELYKVDLSRVVSKYIGETEKQLSKIFDEAELSNAILFFDEADALFGKRSEIKDAHDRYANVEIGYLLQRMEEYSGMVILATNLNKNIDEAFLRRMQFAIEFPFPDTGQRERIWRTVFPTQAPLHPDLDYGFLAERIKLSGGSIKNIALTAAFYAARDACKIGMRQLMIATKREYQKLGKAFLKSDFQPYFEWVEGSQ